MQCYRFGDFELDLDAQRLRLRGEAVHLERRPFDLLVLLVTAQGRVVTRDDIIAALWPKNVIIDFDSGLNTLVRKARSALGDTPDDPQFIETVAGRGYRFIARVEAPAPAEPAAAAAAPEPAAPPPARRKMLSRPVAATILALLLVGGALSAWRWYSLPPGHTRIAVLPFENLTGNADMDYLASGIAEETSVALSRIELPNLSVIGVISARALANSGVSLPKSGRELGVDFIVLSSLRLDTRRIRVTSRLMRVTDGEQLWSATFDRELTNVLALQRELSIAIAEQIRQRLSPEVAAAIDRRQTQNPEAWQLYLKGRYEWTRFQPDSVQRAIEYYRMAVEKDPRYALAWAGIAHALITSVVTIEADRQAVLPAAQDALQRALEYGPDLAETQLALGSFHGFLDHDLPPAEAAARKAIALDPNNAMCHMFLGMVLSQEKKFVEASAMLRRARELDPLFPLMFANSANAALTAGEPQEAVEFASQAIAINPEFWVGYLHLGRAQRALGNYDAALEAFSTAEKLSGDSSSRAMALRADLLVELGREDEARDVLARLLTRSAERYVPPYFIALVYAGLGEADPAIEWLHRAVADGEITCANLNGDRRLDILRGNPRFEPLLNQCRPDVGWDNTD
jgi:TolB-like protein/DNA-binding winged helix-turn-helix (wHTH) protein/Tfp pilus assembly protein PilF